MMRVILSVAAMATMVAVVPSSARASEDERVAAGALAGTRGLGLEGQFAWGEHIVLRGTVQSVRWRHEGVYDGADYVADLSAPTVGAFADLHPFASGFLVSAGVYLGEPDIDLVAQARRTVRINGVRYTRAQIGTVSGTIQVNGAAPFVGVGYNSLFRSDSRWGLRALVGASFTGTPRVTLQSTGGTLSSSRLFQAQIAREAQAVEDDLSDYKAFPVVEIGLTRRF